MVDVCCECRECFMELCVDYFCAEEKTALDMRREIYSGDGVDPTRKHFPNVFAHRERIRE